MKKSAWKKVAVNDNQMTVYKCKQLCFEDRDYDFAGVQNRVQCWCGNVEPKSELIPAPQSQCSMPCPGDFTQKCGGSTTMNVYQSNRYFYEKTCTFRKQ